MRIKLKRLTSTSKRTRNRELRRTHSLTPNPGSREDRKERGR